MLENFQYQAVTGNIGFLAEGFGMTLMLTICGLLGGLISGTVLALIRHFRIPGLSQVALAYVSFFRSMPFILILFWIYFLLPLVLGFPVGAFTAAICAFVIFETAYFSEIVRSGIGAVSRGQHHAALALGMTDMQANLYVVVPQAIRKMMPALITQTVIILQDTSLVYVVGLRDFLVSADIVASRDNKVVELYLFVAVVYLVICSVGSLYADRLKVKSA